MAGQQFKASEIAIKSFLSSNSTIFNIPAYQRGYSWGKEEAYQLFKDIKNFSNNRKANESYYLGNVIIQPTPGEISSRRNIMQIVDGQQRITTLLLLISALRNEIKDKRINLPKISQEDLEDYKAMIRELDELLYFDEDEEDITDGELQLKIYNKDYDKNMRAVIENTINDNLELNINNNYSDNYSRIHREGVQHLTKEEFKKIIKAFKNVLFVEITLSSTDKALTVFENINSTGLSLSAHDLIKNYFYILASRTNENKQYKVEEEIKELFDNKIFKNINEVKKLEEFWKVITGIFSLDKQPKNDPKEIYRKFKLTAEERYAFFSKMEEPELLEESLNNLLKEVKSYYEIYVEIKSYDKEIYDYKHRYERAMCSFVKSTFSSVAPILFLILKQRNENKISEEECNNVIVSLSKYLVRRKTTSDGIKDVKNLSMKLVTTFQKENKLITDDNFKKYIEEQSDQFYRRNIDAIEFIENLKSNNIYSSQNNLALELLVEYEWSLSKNEGFMVSSEKRKVQIEHIMPQTIKDKNRKYYKGWDHIGEDEHITKKDRFGNLTLTFDNQEMSNKPFDEKKKYLIECKFRVNEFFKTIDNWDVNSIENRTEKIAPELEKIWSL